MFFRLRHGPCLSPALFTLTSEGSLEGQNPMYAFRTPCASPGRPRRAVLLTPPSPTPGSLQNVANSCLCHTSEKSPISLIIATDPKMPSRKSFPCHICDP